MTKGKIESKNAHKGLEKGSRREERTACQGMIRKRGI